MESNKEIISKSQHDTEVRVITIDEVKVEVRPKYVFLDRFVIELSDKARELVLERERNLIKAQFEKLFKQQIQDLEANILAYQDLLMIKDDRIKILEKEALEMTKVDTNLYTQEIINLKQVL